MPSPFPGMDPYLEHPEIFPDLHDRLITYLSEALQPNLPQPYFAGIGRRAWIEVSERFIGPDVNVLRAQAATPKDAGGGVAVASPPSSQPKIVHVPHDERREPFLEIYTRQGGERRLVTTIEILSLSNKTPGERGRDLYLRKQQEVLDSKVHLVEVDLLRGGVHTTAVPKDRAIAVTGAFDYHVCKRHFDRFEDYFVYAIQLQDRLPDISIPLLPGDGLVPLNLQAVFDRCYDTGPYSREVRYGADVPVPPLSPEQTAWAQHLLAGKK